MPLISASSLKRFCRHDKVLEKKRPKNQAVIDAADEGTRFGKLVQDWIEGREPVVPEIKDEPWHWYQNMRASWRPPSGVLCEVALGLAHDGRHIHVMEPEPHVYVPGPGAPAPIMTAGRADLAWVGDAAAVVGDLKRSAWRYGPPAQHPQLMALGLAWAARTAKRFLFVGLYDARDASWGWSDCIDLDVDGAEMLTEVREMATMDDEPRPGPWCGGCWEAKNCAKAWEGERR